MYDNYIKYYKKAIRTTLSAEDKKNPKQMIHLFSVIELQSEESYPYTILNKDWGGRKHVRESTNDYCFYIAVDEIENVDEAYSIFNNPLGNFEVDGVQFVFSNDTFTREPSGKCPIILPENMFTDKGIGAVIPRRTCGSAVYCQIDMERKTEMFFMEDNNHIKEIEAIRKLTVHWLGFDIIQRCEHIGNIYFVMPNPYFRSLDTWLSSNPLGLIYRINRCVGNDMPLKMRLIDKHGEDVALDWITDINKDVGLLLLDHDPGLLEQRIYNDQGDLIYRTKPVGFIKRFNFGISVKQADVKLHVTTPSGSKDIITEKFSKFNHSCDKSDECTINKESFFMHADDLRRKDELKANNEFIFFPGAKDDTEKSKLKEQAKDIIKNIINGAQNTCYLCDPYFGLMDIMEYAIRIKNSGVKIRILNSKEDITATDKNAPKKIADFIQNYSAKLYSNIEMRCLKGRSILHDRFIVTDDNIWYLGSSFNEFGNRATCLGKIEKSAGRDIIKQIETWYFSDRVSESIFDLAK